MCNYFDDIIRFWDRNIDFDDILLDEELYKKYENILIFGISYKPSAAAKRLRISFDKRDGFIIVHDKIRYLIMFDYSYCNKNL